MEVRAATVKGETIAGATSGGVLVSQDAGAHWANHGVVRGLGANCVFKVVASGGRLYAATSGGLSISTDRGITWSRVNPFNNSSVLYEIKSVAASGSTVCVECTGGAFVP